MLSLLTFILGLVGIWASWPWQAWLTLILVAFFTEVALND